MPWRRDKLVQLNQRSRFLLSSLRPQKRKQDWRLLQQLRFGLGHPLLSLPGTCKPPQVFISGEGSCRKLWNGLSIIGIKLREICLILRCWLSRNGSGVSYRFKHWWSLLPFPVSPLSNLMQLYSDFPHLFKYVGRSWFAWTFWAVIEQDLVVLCCNDLHHHAIDASADQPFVIWEGKCLAPVAGKLECYAPEIYIPSVLLDLEM